MIQSPVTELEILWAARRVLSDRELTDEDKKGMIFDLQQSASPEGMAFFAPNVSKYIREFLEKTFNELSESVSRSKPGNGGSDPRSLAGEDSKGAEDLQQASDVRKAKGGKG